MSQINTMPSIKAVASIKDGYMARSLCVVDGLPAQVTMVVNVYKYARSDFYIDVWNPRAMRWSKRVYEIEGREVGRMPVLPDEPETLERMNALAALLWGAAEVIVVGGRERDEELMDGMVERQYPEDDAETLGDDATDMVQRDRMEFRDEQLPLDELERQILRAEAPLGNGDESEGRG